MRMREMTIPMAIPKPTLSAVISMVTPAPAKSRGKDDVIISRSIPTNPYSAIIFLLALRRTISCKSYRIRRFSSVRPGLY